MRRKKLPRHIRVFLAGLLMIVLFQPVYFDGIGNAPCGASRYVLLPEAFSPETMFWDDINVDFVIVGEEIAALLAITFVVRTFERKATISRELAGVDEDSWPPPPQAMPYQADQINKI